MVIERETDEGKAKDCICREKRVREGEGSHSSGVSIGKALIVARASRTVSVTGSFHQKKRHPLTQTRTHIERHSKVRNARACSLWHDWVGAIIRFTDRMSSRASDCKRILQRVFGWLAFWQEHRKQTLAKCLYQLLRYGSLSRVSVAIISHHAFIWS